MGDRSSGRWLDPALSLPRQLELEAARRRLPRLPRPDLGAAADSALVQAMTSDHLLRQALARVQELELQAVLRQPARHRIGATELLSQLRG